MAAPNKKYKDSLFVLFMMDDPKKLVEVYNAVLGADFPLTSEVKVNTLENVLYHAVNNDLSFTIEGNLVVLIEDQATLNMNMPLRLLMYVARIYEKLLPSRAVYAERTVKVPRPEFIVLYNGKDEMPDTMELKLSEAFKDAHAKETLELTLTVYNINPGHNEAIRHRSKALMEYSTFVGKIHEYEKEGAPLAEAIRMGVEYCIRNGVMPEFLKKHSSEVNNMLFAEYDPVEARKVAMEEGYEDGFEKGRADGFEKGRADGLERGRADGLEKGRADGLEKGLAEGSHNKELEIARRMKRNGRRTEDIAEDTGLTAEQIKNL